MTGGLHRASGAGGLDLVAVGCSWGGLAAAGRLLEALPDDFEPATVIVLRQALNQLPGLPVHPAISTLSRGRLR